MAPQRMPKEDLKRLVRETPFSSNEVLHLWHRFTEMDIDESGFLSLTEMLKVPELRCNPFAARLVKLFSEDGSGELTFQKFINLFSVFSQRATPETKVVWAFAVWDFDGDDLIGPKDIKRGLYLLTNANMAILHESDSEGEEDPPAGGEGGSTPTPEPGSGSGDVESVGRAAAVTPPGGGRQLARRKSLTQLLTADHINQVLEHISEEIDPEGAGLSFSDFESLASRMPDFLSNFRLSL